jgi:hypothetical protein
LDDLPELAFDHGDIIGAYRRPKVRRKH